MILTEEKSSLCILVSLGAQEKEKVLSKEMRKTITVREGKAYRTISKQLSVPVLTVANIMFMDHRTVGSIVVELGSKGNTNTKSTPTEAQLGRITKEIY